MGALAYKQFLSKSLEVNRLRGARGLLSGEYTNQRRQVIKVAIGFLEELAAIKF